jgi:hypothetical protein
MLLSLSLGLGFLVVVGRIFSRSGRWGWWRFTVVVVVLVMRSWVEVAGTTRLVL